MSKKSVYCIVETRDQADRIVDRLRVADFSNKDISALFADRTTSRGLAHTKSTKAPEGAVKGAGTGGALGGALGWIAGLGVVVIPGAGPFIAAGPMALMLSGAALGAAAGGIVGGLLGFGIPTLEAKRYEGKIKSGSILISVHAENSLQIKRAKEIFTEAKAHDICVTAESAAPKKKETAEPLEEFSAPVSYASNQPLF